MKLNEVLSRFLDYSWILEEPGEYEAEFMTEKYIYGVYFKEMTEKGKRIWNKKTTYWFFQMECKNPPNSGDDKYGILGTGDANAVFGTTIKILDDFISRVHPHIIRFHAKEPSRRKLYLRMFGNRYKNMRTYEEDENLVFELLFN